MAKKKDQSGPNNPNWKGGVSKNHYRYKKRSALKNPMMIKAHKRVAYAIKVGKLIKQPCEGCGSTEVQAHHDDYWKPLDVRWLCDPCHRKHHQEMKAKKKEDDGGVQAMDGPGD